MLLWIPGQPDSVTDQNSLAMDTNEVKVEDGEISPMMTHMVALFVEYFRDYFSSYINAKKNSSIREDCVPSTQSIVPGHNPSIEQRIAEYSMAG